MSEVKITLTGSEDDVLACIFCNNKMADIECKQCPRFVADFTQTPAQAIREANTGTRETGFKPGTWLKGRTFAAESLGEVV